MTVQLGNIELDEHLLLDGLESAPDVSVSTVVTLGGLSLPTVMPLSGGRSLSLVALYDGGLKGRFFYHQLLAIKALAALGEEVPLIHYKGTFQVLIVSTAEITLRRHCRNPQPNDVCIGPLQLLEV